MKGEGFFRLYFPCGKSYWTSDVIFYDAVKTVGADIIRPIDTVSAMYRKETKAMRLVWADHIRPYGCLVCFIQNVWKQLLDKQGMLD